MTDETPPARRGRENRLLLITVVVSVAVLLLLARFRFPGDGRADVAPAPLQRLAARATYEDLASIVAELSRRLTPSIMVLRVRSRAPEPGFPSKLLTPPPGVRSFQRFVPAVYVRPDVAIAGIGPDDVVGGLVGDESALPVMLVNDPVRQIALLRVPPASERALSVWEQRQLPDLPRYVALAEGTRGGLGLRPVFLSRTDGFADPRWDRLQEIGGGQTAPPGSLVFSLEGALIGLVVLGEGYAAIAPATLVAGAAEQLMKRQIVPTGTIGIEVQDLTPALTKATGAQYGVVVTSVMPGGPAEGRLQVGDVIEAIGQERVFSPERFVVNVTGMAPGSTLTLRLTRRGTTTDVSMTVGEPQSAQASPHSAELGLMLRTVAGVGAEVVGVVPFSAGARAGLMVGDVITHLEGASTPDAARVTKAFGATVSGGAVLLGLQRAARPMVVALEKP